MNIYIQVGIATATKNLNRGLLALFEFLKMDSNYFCIYINYEGKRVSRKMERFVSDGNWPLRTDEVSITISPPTSHTFEKDETRMLVRISPLDENWSHSIDCPRTGPGQKYIGPRSLLEGIPQRYPNAIWSNIVEFAISAETGLEMKVVAEKVREIFRRDHVEFRFLVGDLVDPLVVPYFNGYSWRQDHFLVDIQRKRALKESLDPELFVIKNHQYTALD